MSFGFFLVAGLQGASGVLNDGGLPLFFFDEPFIGVEATGESFFTFIHLMSPSGHSPSTLISFPRSEMYLSRAPCQ